MAIYVIEIDQTVASEVTEEGLGGVSKAQDETLKKLMDGRPLRFIIDETGTVDWIWEKWGSGSSGCT